ncbi:MAG: hypothetical protein O2960_20405 [Verrucomicrobia bacterium]|nr:hypothetical protein [Verrucomicrobiota bacterium]
MQRKVSIAGTDPFKKPFHPRNEIPSWRLDDNVKVVVHQAKRVDMPGGLLSSLAESLEKALSIDVVRKNRLATVFAVHHMANGSGKFYALWSRHTLQLQPDPDPILNCEDRPLFVKTVASGDIGAWACLLIECV